MRLFSLLYFTCLGLWIQAQNLVPNGDFESNTHGQVLDWQQPIDDYYHYNVSISENDSTVMYNAVNGLCLLQPDPSEFLVARLKQPLMKGKRYCMSMNIFYSTTFIGSVKPVQTIDIAFSDTSIDVWKRRKLYREPRIKFPFINPDGSFFQPGKIIFEAEGTERYIIIGKFHTRDEQSILSIEDKRTMIWKELYYTSDSIKKYYTSLLPAPNPVYSKKEIKKETKRLNDSIKRLESLKMEAIRANSQFYHQKVDDLVNKPDDTLSSFQRYHVRIYFDNICVAPVLLNDECECSDKAQPKFKVGQTYRLNNIHFDLDKSTFRPESYTDMDQLVTILKQYPEMVIQLNGHTDSLNTEKYNLDLSNRRAKAVYDYVVKKGIASGRLKWKGYGESIPITDNATEESRAINRRVEFIILKN